MAFHAFADDCSVDSIGDLTLENNADYLSVYGDAQFGKDQLGLQNLLALQQVINEAVTHLQNMANLPERTVLAPHKQIDNPFL